MKIHSNSSFVPVLGHKNRLTPQDVDDPRTKKPGIRAYEGIIGKILTLFNFAVSVKAKNERGEECIWYFNTNSLIDWKARQEKAHHLHQNDFNSPGSLDKFILQVKKDIDAKKKAKENHEETPAALMSGNEQRTRSDIGKDSTSAPQKEPPPSATGSQTAGSTPLQVANPPDFNISS